MLSMFSTLQSLQDPSDPTIGFLLDGMNCLCCLVRKYIAGENKTLDIHDLRIVKLQLPGLYTKNKVVVTYANIWSSQLSGMFSCKMHLNYLLKDPSFPLFEKFCSVRKSMLPKRWLVILSKLSTCDKPQLKLPLACLSLSCCVMCKKNQEMNPLGGLEHSPAAYSVWTKLHIFTLYALL